MKDQTKLTSKRLDSMKSNSVIASGQTEILHPWFNDLKDKSSKYRRVNWIAMRGVIGDWAIYHSLDANLEKSDYLDGDSHLERSLTDVYKWGAKLRDFDKIKELVPCSKKALERYRL